MSPPSVHALAHAKLNLSLRVLAREASGYHQIETIFCALELADEIDVTPSSGGITLDVKPDGPPDLQPPDLGPADQNLAVRAAALFAAATGGDGNVRITLLKRIPAGAGLGGGSSDAAAVLRALNRLHGEPLTTQELHALGLRLGSDVPFFLADAPLALGWGRGERLMPLPALPPAPVVLAVPAARVSTADAYAALRPSHTPTPHVLQPPRSWQDVAAIAHNDFEAVVFERVPAARTLRQALEGEGAVCARLTGSGSVVFGVFDSNEAAHLAVARIAQTYPDAETILTRTRA